MLNFHPIVIHLQSIVKIFGFIPYSKKVNAKIGAGKTGGQFQIPVFENMGKLSFIAQLKTIGGKIIGGIVIMLGCIGVLS